MKRAKTKIITTLLAVTMAFSLTACGGFTQSDIDKAVNDATATLNAEISELNADIAEKDAKITTLEGEKTALTTDKAELEADVTALEEEKAELESDKAELEDEVETLEAEKKALSDENAELEASITAKNTEIATLTSSVTSLEDEKAILNGRVSDLNAQITTLNERITELEESSEADGAEITELKAKVSTLTEEKANLNAKITELEGTIADKNVEIADLEADVASLEAMQEKLNKEITDLTYQLNTKNTEITTLNSSISALETEKADLEEQVATLEASISAKETEIIDLTSSVATLTVEKQTLTDRVAALEKENETLKNCIKGNHSETLTYTPNNDGTHYGTYSCCGVVTESVSCSGGEATCLVGKICEICGFEYDTAKAPENHASGVYTYTDNEDDATHTKTHECGTTIDTAEEHTVTTWTYWYGTHEGNCDHCGASLWGYCDENMDSTTGKCTVCDTLVAYISVTSGETVTYYHRVGMVEVLGENATVLKSGDTVTMCNGLEDSYNFSFVIPEGVTFDGGEFTITIELPYALNNYGTIAGGTFDTICIENGSISGNVKITSSLDFRNNYDGYSIIDLSNADLGDEISLYYNSEFRSEIPVYDDVLTLPDGYCVFMHPYTYTETINSETQSYMIRKHSHTFDTTTGACECGATSDTSAE